jgi:hypothetical protein
MKRYYSALVVVIIGMLFLACSHTESKPKAFTIFNDASKKVYIYELKGIGIYAEGQGPQKFGLGGYRPDLLAGYKTFGTIHLDFPIEVLWGYASWDYDDINGGVAAPKGEIQKFQSVEGLEGNKIENEGTLLLVFGQDNQWRLKFISGDSHLQESDIRENHKGIGKILFNETDNTP